MCSYARDNYGFCMDFIQDFAATTTQTTSQSRLPPDSDHQDTLGQRNQRAAHGGTENLSRILGLGHCSPETYNTNVGQFRQALSISDLNMVEKSNSSSFPEASRAHRIRRQISAVSSKSLLSGKIKLVCSFGGKFMHRPSDGRLRYVGGETRLLSLKEFSWNELTQKTAMVYNQPHVIKYQLPDEELDALISVSSDEDLQNMIEEYHGLENALQRFRIFLVPLSDSKSAEMDDLAVQGDPDYEYVAAVNNFTTDLNRSLSCNSLGSQFSGLSMYQHAPDMADSWLYPPVNLVWQRDSKDRIEQLLENQSVINQFIENDANARYERAAALSALDGSFHSELFLGHPDDRLGGCISGINDTEAEHSHSIHHVRSQTNLLSSVLPVPAQAYKNNMDPSFCHLNGLVNYQQVPPSVGGNPDFIYANHAGTRQLNPHNIANFEEEYRPNILNSQNSAPATILKQHQLFAKAMRPIPWLVDARHLRESVPSEVAKEDVLKCDGQASTPVVDQYTPSDSFRGQSSGIQSVESNTVVQMDDYQTGNLNYGYSDSAKQDILNAALVKLSENVASESYPDISDDWTGSAQLSWQPEVNLNVNSYENVQTCLSRVPSREASLIDQDYLPIRPDHGYTHLDHGFNSQGIRTDSRLYDEPVEATVTIEDVTDSIHLDMPLATPVIPHIQDDDSEDAHGSECQIEDDDDPAAAVEVGDSLHGLQTIRNADLEELSELGSGTFGTVFYGKWRGSDVAIKRIKRSCFTGRPSEQEKQMKDFWREAQILSKLHHPNVVAFYGVVPDGAGGTLATVTEYMVNGSLRHTLMRKDRSLDMRKKLIIAMDAAFGMEYLHSRNIVHFDLKCDNLLVNLRDPQRPICKVADFGLSRMKHNTLVSGGVRGTLPWMAPELLNGSTTRVSEKVDVFSFGITLWEILTGDEPYADMHCGTIIGGIVNNTLRPPIPENCDPGWRKLMEECWLGNPDARPPFKEIANRLRAMATQSKGRAHHGVQ